MYANLIEKITYRELKENGEQIPDDNKKIFKILDKSEFRVALIKKCEETFYSIFCDMVDEDKKDQTVLSELKAKNNP